MGHRKHSQPRRGSLAYLPRKRAGRLDGRVRTWPQEEGGKPHIQAHAGFKAGCVQLVSIDDREHTPNHGKQLVSLGTVLATPPATVIGVRGYTKGTEGQSAAFDIYAKEIPKKIAKYVNLKSNPETEERAKKMIHRIHKLFVLLAVTPDKVGTGQKAPYVFEAGVDGGTNTEQLDYAVDLLGKQINVSQVFETGAEIDVAAITKGKGWQSVIKRYGAKRKQHKSRKSVREIGSLGPISPQYVMYTVPRAGQMGFHQRTEYNKRIMIMENTKDTKHKINPDGGYNHFGMVDGDYVIVKGSVPGTIRRMIKLRSPMRTKLKKVAKPNILEVVA